MPSDAMGRDRFSALGFFAFAATRLVEDRNYRLEAPAAQRAIAYAAAVGRLLNDLQRERGSSALYLGSRGAQFRTELQGIRAAVDQMAREAAAAAAACKDFALLASVGDAAQILLRALDEARANRPGIDRLDFSTAQSFTNWTTPIRHGLTSLRRIGHVLCNPDLVQTLDAYIALQEGLEKSAQERATGSGALAAGQFELQVYQRFLTLGALQDADFAIFAVCARPEQLAFFETVQRDAIFAEVLRLRAAIYEGGGGTGGVAAPYWFQVTTQRIEQINRVRDRLAEDMHAICHRLLAGSVDPRLARAWSLGLRLASPLVILFGGRQRLGELRQGYEEWQSQAAARHAAARTAMAEREAEQQKRAERDARERVAAVEIAKLVDGIVAGDLSSRLSKDGKDGFFLTMSEQLNRLTEMLQAMVGEVATVTDLLGQGDLTAMVQGSYGGIFGQLKESANRMAGLLRDFSQRLSGSAEAVRLASSEIATGSEDLAQRTESQAASLEETAASMHEVTATVRQNADNAQLASRLAASAHETALQGGAVVGDAVAAVSGIEASAQKISDIVSLIDEIAFQTNLLALNASVEAARAGEAGKGFAVVAQEVRALAQRSANASKDIKRLISESNARVKHGAGLVNQTGGSLAAIVAAVKQVNDIVAEIAAASGEQAVGLDQINTAIGSMDETTQRNGALVEQTAASARSLNQQASDLAELVGFFRA